MKSKKWIGVWILLIGFIVTTACAKKLMPPEIEASGGITEEEAMVESDVVESDLAEETPVAPTEDAFGPEVSEEAPLQEEDIGEFGEPVEPGSAQAGEEAPEFGFGADAGKDFGSAAQGMPGDGSSGSFQAEPFAGDSGANADRDFGFGSDAGKDFGSASPGMPGDGSSGSFQAEPLPGGTTAVDEILADEATEELQEARLLSFQPSVALKDIHFKFDQFDLDDENKKILQENARYLKEHPDIKIEIQGHCDERGTNNYNLALGDRRAAATKRYLSSLGVDDSRLYTISYGEEKPFCFDSNENCWWQNRRAHFMVSQ